MRRLEKYRIVYWVLLAAALSLTSGLAEAQVIVGKWQMAGNLAAAWADTSFSDSAGDYTFASLTVVPVVNNGSTVYIAYLGVSSWLGSGGGDFVSASGFIPVSAVKSGAGGVVSVNFDMPQFQGLYWYEFSCDAYGNCSYNYTPPASFPVQATLTPYTGVGGYQYLNTGGFQSQQFDPPFTFTTKSTGNYTTGTASFSGTIGPVTAGPGWDTIGTSNISVNKGTTTVTITKTQ